MIPTDAGDLWADMLWRRQRVALEYDGAVTYRRRPGNDPGDVVVREKLRHVAIEE